MLQGCGAQGSTTSLWFMEPPSAPPRTLTANNAQNGNRPAPVTSRRPARPEGTCPGNSTMVAVMSPTPSKTICTVHCDDGLRRTQHEVDAGFAPTRVWHLGLSWSSESIVNRLCSERLAQRLSFKHSTASNRETLKKCGQ